MTTSMKWKLSGGETSLSGIKLKTSRRYHISKQEWTRNRIKHSPCNFLGEGIVITVVVVCPSPLNTVVFYNKMKLIKLVTMSLGFFGSKLCLQPLPDIRDFLRCFK